MLEVVLTCAFIAVVMAITALPSGNDSTVSKVQVVRDGTDSRK